DCSLSLCLAPSRGTGLTATQRLRHCRWDEALPTEGQLPGVSWLGGSWTENRQPDARWRELARHQAQSRGTGDDDQMRPPQFPNAGFRQVCLFRWAMLWQEGSGLEGVPDTHARSSSNAAAARDRPDC